MLPIVFTFLFYKMPSGLVLYWLVNTVLSVAQQYYINRGGHDEEPKDTETKPPKKSQVNTSGKPAGRQARKTRAKKG